jgi:hypothetical protein
VQVAVQMPEKPKYYIDSDHPFLGWIFCDRDIFFSVMRQREPSQFLAFKYIDTRIRIGKALLY